MSPAIAFYNIVTYLYTVLRKNSLWLLARLQFSVLFEMTE